jgi:hypothetical protein
MSLIKDAYWKIVVVNSSVSINDCTEFDDHSNGFCQISARVQKKWHNKAGMQMVRGFYLPSWFRSTVSNLSIAQPALYRTTRQILPPNMRPAKWAKADFAQACCGAISNVCCDVSAPRGAVFKLSPALLLPSRLAIACTN